MPLRTLRSRLFYRLPGGVLILLACSVALVVTVALLGLVVWRDREQTLAAARMAADTGNRLLAERTARMLMAGDGIILRLTAPPDGIPPLAAPVEAVWMADTAGRALSGTIIPAATDSPALMAAVQAAGGMPVVRRAAVTLAGVEPPLILARPLADAGGTIQGYAAVALTGGAVDAALRPPPAVPGTAVLTGLGGAVLARVPTTSAAPPETGSIQTDSRDIPGYPLAVRLSVDGDAALTAWRARLAEYTAYGAGTILMTVAIGLLALHRARREREAEDALQQAYDSLGERVDRRTAELTEANARLEHALADKEILLKEVQHRVKNNLQVICSLLRLQAGRLDGSIRDIFDESLRRIQSMSLVHELLYRSEEPARIDLADYLEHLCARLQRSFGPSAVRLTVEAQSWTVDVDRAMPLAMIASELVSNALRHAHPGGGEGLIQVTLAPPGPDGGVVLQVEDDGVGLPPHVGIAAGSGRATMASQEKGLGLILVQSLVAQAGATLHIAREDGTRFTVRVPPAAAARAA
ncbi:two-component sensor histidine kinase [Azospirillum fermentarium]|uniref:sensor histidine kinase n=1 Tax=Azospirillum fermentarium TaxID=1233114 RepID=UPI002227A117|nr:sensor histidine kinase [Azospirillum fermentarium]MCW2247163.1 two-component sensor histidine kinase [Azospirillum fermentarium]